MQPPILNAADFADQLHHAALAQNTRIAYDKGWHCFAEYCNSRAIQPLEAPPEIVADFFVERASKPSPKSGKVLSLGTLTLYRSAINKRFQEADRPSPTTHAAVDAVLKGLARLCPRTPRKVKALREDHIRAMLNLCPATLIGQRNAAILAVGLCGRLASFRTMQPARVGCRVGGVAHRLYRPHPPFQDRPDRGGATGGRARRQTHPY